MCETVNVGGNEGIDVASVVPRLLDVYRAHPISVADPIDTVVVLAHVWALRSRCRTN